MASGRQILTLVVLAALFVFLILQTQVEESIEPLQGLAQVEISGAMILAEVADEQGEIVGGLMFRDSMPRDRGMLFIFETEEIRGFWMMNMRFSVDMIWLDSERQVVDVTRGAVPCLVVCASYRPSEPAQYVLEVNSGVAEELGISVGSSATFLFR